MATETVKSRFTQRRDDATDSKGRNKKDNQIFLVAKSASTSF
jgi:hypothetical protein